MYKLAYSTLSVSLSFLLFLSIYTSFYDDYFVFQPLKRCYFGSRAVFMFSNLKRWRFNSVAEAFSIRRTKDSLNLEIREWDMALILNEIKLK